MKQRGTSSILAAALGAGALLAATPAFAGDVRVVVGAAPAEPAAAGLLVPGRGPTFSRGETLDALAEIPRGDCPCPWTIYLTLPRAESHEYEGLERVWIAGPGYPSGSLLVSDRTRVPGLVSVHDLAPTAESLEHGDAPPVTARRQADVGRRLASLETRLDRVHDAKTKENAILAALIALLAVAALYRRSAFLGRAALLTAPVALASSLGLSALAVSEPTLLLVILGALTGAGALAAAAVTRDDRALAIALLAIFPLYLVVFAISTETSSLAAIGPRPENGGRFYGFNNLVETLLLVPALLGAALLGLRLLVPVAVLVLVTVAASFAGADGGGILVFAAGFLFLWLRLRAAPLTLRNLALAGAGAVAIGLLLVGADAALGGESHVTRALRGGPIELAGDLGHRLARSAGGVFSSLYAAAIIPVALAVLAWLGLRRPRLATVDALLVALAVSLLVNDAPREVSAFGALSCAALRFWEEARRANGLAGNVARFLRTLPVRSLGLE